MGFTINDGKGKHGTAGVDSQGRLQVNAVSQSAEHFANHTLHQAYNVLFSATPTTTGDCFFYMKNTSDIDLVIEGFYIRLVATEYIQININDTGTPAGGTGVTPVNLNSGSGNTATGIFQHGNDITNLTSNRVSARYYHASSDHGEGHNFEQDVILKKNGVLTMYVETGGTAISGHIVFNYHNNE